jgi:RNA polymerase sigma-70 factor (ECF subfamily)
MNVPDREPLPEDQMVSREKYDLIKECIAELKPDYKSIIILRDIQNYTYQEIADILNIPLGTVKSNISRARALLRETLKSRLAGYDERRVK